MKIKRFDALTDEEIERILEFGTVDDLVAAYRDLREHHVEETRELWRRINERYDAKA